MQVHVICLNDSVQCVVKDADRAKIVMEERKEAHFQRRSAGWASFEDESEREGYERVHYWHIRIVDTVE